MLRADRLEGRWWQEREGTREAAECCVSSARSVEEETADRLQLVLDSFALYGHGTLGDCNGLEPLPDAALTMGVNVIASAVDTLISEVTQNEPRPVVMTVGGGWTERKRAERLTQYLEAKYSEHDVFGLMRRAAKDAAIAGLGILRAYENGDDGCVEYERIHPLNFLVDDRNALDVAPRLFYVRRAIDRDALKELFPEMAEQLTDAPAAEDSYWHAFESGDDVVEVIEAWRVASRRGSEDGRHMLVVPGCDPLCDEVYERQTPPLVFLRAIEPSSGFWGEMPVQRAAPAQLELNKLLGRLQDSMHLHAVIRAFVQPGAILDTHLNNEIGAIVQCAGPPPTFAPTPSMPPDVYMHIDRLKEWAFELMGVSQLSATMRREPGLNSEPAQRTYHEFQTRRHVNFERDIEHGMCELGRETIRLERAIAEREKEAGEKHEIPYATDSALDVADWFDLDIDEDRILVQVRAASSLRRDPAGRMKDLQELVGMLQLPPEVFWRMVDDPDLESVRAHYTAPVEIVEKTLDRMLDGGKYTPPAPYMNLDAALLTTAMAIQRAEVAGAPEEGLKKLRQFYTAIPDLQARIAEKVAADAAAAMPPPPGAMPPGAMPPGGAPMPPMPPEMAGGAMPPMPPGGPPMPPMAPPGPIPPDMPPMPPV